MQLVYNLVMFSICFLLVTCLRGELMSKIVP